jgi:hypothetical protein
MRTQNQTPNKSRPFQTVPLEAVRAAWLARRFRCSPELARLLADIALDRRVPR